MVKGGLYINQFGNKRWKQGKYGEYATIDLHRLNGPAIEFVDGSKEWYQNGKKHRLDGPAEEYSDGENLWYYQDYWIECSSQKEFERLIKLRLLW